MKTRVTMRDVAAVVGVSPMTVSRALRGDGTVSKKTRDIVRATAEDLGYVYDTTAQAFRAQRSGFVAVCLPSLNNANFAATHNGLTEALEGSGLQVLLGCTDYSAQQEEHIVRQLLERKPEALILTGGHHSEGTRALLAVRDIPVVEMWDIPTSPLQHVVGFSNAAAMAPVVQHLANTGRRKLAFLGADGITDARGAERRAGVIRMAAELGLPPVREIGIGPAPVSMTDSARVVRELETSLPDTDALVCVSDIVAFGALTACQRLGFNVPDEVAVTGFGAFEIACVANPALTTVDVFADEIGARAGQLITELLSGEAPEGTACIDTGSVLRPGETS